MKNVISVQASILQGLQQLCRLTAQDTFTLFVVDSEQKVLGSLTDGDLRRHLAGGGSLGDSITKAMHSHFCYVRTEEELFETAQQLRQNKIQLVPKLDTEGRLVRVYDLVHLKAYLPVDAVIMAGGRGERLRPLTDTTPKPLLPLGNKAIMEYNVDNIASMGIDNITVCIRYLGEQIKAFFGDGASRGVHMRYITEEKPLGTFGAVSLIEHFEHDVVLVMNSDLFTNINLENFYLHFIKSGADMSVATIPYNISVPYAVMQTRLDCVLSFEEKPTYTYYSNAGIYLIRRSLINELSRNEKCDTTDLMERLLQQGGKLTYFPIVGYWLDIGTPEEYQKAKDIIKYLNHVS